MNKIFKTLFAGLLMNSLWAVAATAQKWELTDGQVTYLASHKLHDTNGLSREVKGRGQCTGSMLCDFLVAVPLKSFDSQNSNRDQHMLKVTGGAINPMVTVRLGVNNPNLQGKTSSTAAIAFAGVELPAVPVAIETKKISDTEYTTKSDFSISLKSFGVESPSLLGMPVSDEVKIHFEGTWKAANF